MLNQVIIDRLSNHCRLYGASADAHLIDNEIKRISVNQLPQIIGTEIDRQLSSLNHGNGIYRINKIQLKFSLLRSDLLLGRHLADVLAERLVNSLSQQLTSDSGNVVYFENEADYVSALMAGLLQGSAWNTWVYQEFSSLRHLEAIEAVVQLLLPRYFMVNDLVAGLLRRQRFAHFLAVLNDEQATRLFHQWTGYTLVELFKKNSLPELPELKKWLSLLRAVNVKTDDATEPLALLSLKVFFSIQAQASLQTSLAVLWVSAHYSFLLRYGVLLMPLLKQVPTDRASLKSLFQTDEVIRQIATDLLFWADAKSERVAYLEEIFQATKNTTAVKQKEVPPSAPESFTLAATQIDSSQKIYSEFAGLVLLLPMIISLGLHKIYQPAILRSALMRALYDDEKIIQPDWLSLLLPDVDEALFSDASLPQIWRHGITENKQKEIERLVGEKQLACLLLAHFAARLSGLQRSSDAYLRTQFLLHKGVIKVDEQQVTVQLEPMPLYIVLHMAGLCGWQVQLPWQKRKLSIEVMQ